MAVTPGKLYNLTDNELIQKLANAQQESETAFAIRREFNRRFLASQKEAAIAAKKTSTWTRWSAIGVLLTAFCTFCSVFLANLNDLGKFYDVSLKDPNETFAPSASASSIRRGTIQPVKQTVAAYLADGYEIAEKREEQRAVPGEPPYENLKRVVHITTYRLERGAETVTCEVVYDSQRESIATACR